MNDLPPPGATLREVLPGTPEDLDELAAELESYVDGAAAAARGLRQLDSGGWVGEAADAFWSSVGDVLKKLDDAAFALQETSFALRTYTTVLREAQVDVRRALGLIDEAERDSRAWSAQNADALVENLAAPYTGTATPMSSDDPGEPLRRQADTLITEAKDRVATAALHAAERLRTAADHAPDRPGFWSSAAHIVSEVAGGAAESVSGMASFTFKLSPAYAIIDPDGYVENQVGIAKGLAHGVTHPVDFTKAVLDWDTWAQSPGRALGHLLPTVALALATAGAGAAGKGAEAASEVKAFEEAGEAAKGLESTGRGVERLSPGLQSGTRAETRGLTATAAEGRAAATVVSKAEAQELLVSKGFNSLRAESFVESFEGPISARETQVGERFLRYTDNPTGKGSFLTTTKFDTPTDAVKGLALEDYGNQATYVQEVTVRQQSLVLEGRIAGGGKGIGQTVITDPAAFEFGPAHPYP